LRRRVTRALAFLLLTAAACPADDGPGLRPGTPAPTFLVTTPGGEPLSLAQFQGRVLIIELWSPHCAPCRVTLPRLAALYREHRGRGLAVVGLGVQAGAAEIRSVREALALPFPVALADERTARVYRAAALPTTILIDKQGTVRATVRGLDATALDALERQAVELLGRSRATGTCPARTSPPGPPARPRAAR